MKTIRRLALVFLLTFGAAACTTNIMGPETETETLNPDGNDLNPDGNDLNPDGND